jgi:hypothetical protein
MKMTWKELGPVPLESDISMWPNNKSKSSKKSDPVP